MAQKIELRDHQRELHAFRSRLTVAGVMMVIGFCILLARLTFLQVYQHDYYRLLAEQNRVTILPLVPSRGVIRDREGVILANNFGAYTLEITPAKVDNTEDVINNLSKYIQVTQKDKFRFSKLLELSADFSSVPIRTHLNDDEVAKFAANNFRFPGVELKARLFRHYPNGELAAHIIGYMGRISEGNYKDLVREGAAKNYSKSDYIGKVGLEQRYEEELRGISGFEHVETDAAGFSVRTLRSSSPVPGNNLVLSLDVDLQQVAERAFGDKKGALIALNPRTGGILAMVSKPSFDPNLFVDGIDSVHWESLSQSDSQPLNNRAIQGLYPPASTFKLFMALAALETKKRDSAYTIFDPGYFVLNSGGHVFKDWKEGGHGEVNLHKAIVESVDTYFYELAHDMGIDAIHDFVVKFGFGSRSGIDLDGEVASFFPSQKWKEKRFKQKWFAGDTISVGIGQGYVSVTPIQLACGVAAIANRGAQFKPHLVNSVENVSTKTVRRIEPQLSKIVRLNDDYLKTVVEAMVDVTKPGGTAARAGYGAKYQFAGKTGTAQVVGLRGQKYEEDLIEERFRDHALFAGFAPAHEPEIVVVVIVENGGKGSRTAAPIARKVIDQYLLNEKRDTYPLFDPSSLEKNPMALGDSLD